MPTGDPEAALEHPGAHSPRGTLALETQNHERCVVQNIPGPVVVSAQPPHLRATSNAGSSPPTSLRGASQGRVPLSSTAGPEALAGMRTDQSA